MTPNRLKAVAIGGGAAGVASQIPYLEWANLACCALVVGGAVLAVYLARRGGEETSALQYRDGALIGFLTGVTATIVSFVVARVLRLGGGDEVDEQMQEALAQAEGSPEWVLGLIESMATGWFQTGVTLVLFSAFGTLGGILAVAVIGRKNG